MTDLVVTCPRPLWRTWLREGDAAGEPPTGQLYQWELSGRARPPIDTGDRLYVVAFDRLRGWAPVTDLRLEGGRWLIIRAGDAIACTIPDPIPGFRGWRRRWWPLEVERPFPHWRQP